jgi:hypothetical protein
MANKKLPVKEKSQRTGIENSAKTWISNNKALQNKL